MTNNLKSELTELIDPHRNKLAGTIGLSPTVVKVTNRPGFVWVRLFDNPNEAIQAQNSTVSPKYNMPVFVSFDGVKYTVDDVDTNRYANWGTDSAFLANHANQHSMMFQGGGGGDVVWIDSQQFLPLLVLPQGETGSSYVSVINYPYKNTAGDYLYVGSTGTYIPPNPSGSSTNIQLVAVQDSDGAIYTQAGAAFSASVSGTSSFLPYIPDTLNANDIPLAAIIRRSSVSGSIVNWDDIIDIRQFYGGGSGGSGTSNMSWPASDGNYYVAKDASWTLMPSGTTGAQGPIGPSGTAGPPGATGPSGTGGSIIYGLDLQDLSTQISGSVSHFTFTPAAVAVIVALNGDIVKPADVTLDVDGLGFTMSYVPEAPDNLMMLRTTDPGTGTSGGGGHTIQDTGTPLTQRANLNFVGMTVEDDAGNYATKITPLAIDTSGWNTPTETWTYASTSTFTIPTDLTTRFVKGTRLRWKQGGAYKYGSVISSSYGAPNTTVTIVVNTDFTIANSAITDVGWSYQATPLGYPIWVNFTSVVTATTGSITSYTVNTARYAMIGAIVHAYLDITITNKGTGSGGMICTTPFTFLQNNQGGGREASVIGVAVQAFVLPANTTIIIFMYDVNTVLVNNYRLVISITAEV